MFARLNFVDLRTETMKELEEFWRGRVSAYKGMTKAYHQLKPGTGHSLSVVLFDTEQNMRDNLSTLKVVAQDASKYRLSEPQVHMTEVVAEVAGAKGAKTYSRVADVTMKVPRLGEVIKGWPEHVKSYQTEAGFRHAYLCGDRSTGRLFSVTYWGSKADCEANEKSGAFMATVDPYKDMMAIPPVRSYWDVTVVIND